MDIIRIILQVAVPVLQVGLCLLMVLRGAYRQFRYFFVFTIMAVVIGILRSAVSNDYAVYFYIYYSTEIINTTLCLLAIHEAFHYVFRNFYQLPGFRYLFPSVAAVMLFIAALRSYLLHGSDMEPIVSIILSLVIAIDFLQVGMFGLFFILARVFKMRW